MYLFLFIVLLIALFAVLFFTVPARVFLRLDTDSTDLRARLSWLFPFFEIRAAMHDYSPCVSVYLFKKKVLYRVLKKKKGSGGKMTRYLRFAELDDAHIRADYGMGNPFDTAMAQLCFQLAEHLTGKTLAAQPDYLSDHAYVVLEADADFNLGKTVANALQKKTR